MKKRKIKKRNRQKRNWFVSLITVLLVALSIISFGKGCSSDEFDVRRERGDKFELLKVDFNYAMNRAAAWANRTRSYSEEMPPYGPPESDLSKVNAVFHRYERKEANCRKEARKIFISLCKNATVSEDFAWIYQSRSTSLREQDRDINKTFIRGVVDEVFLNKYFKPDSNWVEFRKSILGREFYIQK